MKRTLSLSRVSGDLMVAVLTCATFFCTSHSLFAQSLKWKFTPAEQFYIQEQIDTNQTTSVLGQSNNQKSKQTTLFNVRVLGITEEGTTNLEMKIEQIKSQGATSSGDQVFKRMEGATFDITLGADGQVTKFGGYNDFVKQVSAGDEALGRLFQSLMSEDAAKRSMTAIFQILPVKPEADTWNQTSELTLGPYGSLAVKQDFERNGTTTVEGVECVKIKMTASTTYETPTISAEELPFKISKGNLKAEKLTGELAVDPEKGRIVKFDREMKFGGSVTVTIADQSEEMKIQQTQKTTIEFFDEKPKL